MAMLVIARLGISNGYLLLVNPVNETFLMRRLVWHRQIAVSSIQTGSGKSRKTNGNPPGKPMNIWGMVRFFPKP